MTSGTNMPMPSDRIDLQTLTIKLRLRDKHTTELNRQARAVNFVWNYCNETQQKAAQDGTDPARIFDAVQDFAGIAETMFIKWSKT